MGASILRKTNFNPRSLTGATESYSLALAAYNISIHAPLRERRDMLSFAGFVAEFQSTLPYGSDMR